jgi:hypothetical protein
LRLRDLEVGFDGGNIEECVRFGFRNQFLSALVLRKLSPLETGNFSKILVMFGDRQRETEIMGDVIVSRRPFDILSYISSNDKRDLVFTAIRDELLRLSEEFGWNTVALADRLSKLDGSPLDNVYEIARSRRLSPDRKSSASIKVNWDEESLRLAVRKVDRKRGEAEEYEFQRIAMGDPFPWRFIRGLSWIGNDRVRLLWNNKEPSDETVLLT